MAKVNLNALLRHFSLTLKLALQTLLLKRQADVAC